MKVLQINSVYNYGSTGRIAESIGKKVIDKGGANIVAYGRTANTGISETIKIGNKWDQAWHLLNTRAFDTHGFHSTNSTKELIVRIKSSNPDIIHLHNLHGYYLNVEVLFEFLKTYKRPIVWTLHDCWAYTGHCSYYERVKCEKWKVQCNHCPLQHFYPESKFIDNSKGNFKRKKDIFNGVDNLTLVTVSKWLQSETTQSFLKSYPSLTIYNGIDFSIFRPKEQNLLKQKMGFSGLKIVLGVANEWSSGKGLHIFLEMSQYLDSDTRIILVGINKMEMKKFPKNVLGISRTNNNEELADYYAMADVFVTPSIAETFGMVVAEALCCGTPCVVNNSSALPELIDESVGLVVSNEVGAYTEAVKRILQRGKQSYFKAITQKSAMFDLNLQLNSYYQLYLNLINSN